MPRETALSASQNHTSPDYVGLVSFLLEPFLEDPQSLSIHCEQVASTKKLWLRVAFDANDKGKVFGRGGRNIQAIRTVLNTAATNVNQSIYLDIYGNEDLSSKEKSFRKGDAPSRGRRDRKNNFDERPRVGERRLSSNGGKRCDPGEVSSPKERAPREGTRESDRNYQGRRRRGSRERPSKTSKPLSN